MSWVMVGVAAVGAMKGMQDSKVAKQKADSHDKYRRVALENSPWTNMGDPGAAAVGNTDAMSGALGGGLQGAAIGSMFRGGGQTQNPQITNTQSLGATNIPPAQIRANSMYHNQFQPQYGRSPWMMG